MAGEKDYATEEQFLAVRFALAGGDPVAARRVSMVIALGEQMQKVLEAFEAGEKTAEEISKRAGSREVLGRLFEDILEVQE